MAGIQTETGKSRKRCFFKSPIRFENDHLDQSLPFYFDLPLACRVLVDSREQLELLDSVLGHVIMIGIDTETRPTLYNTPGMGRNRTSLLQLASRSERGNEMVFIIDLICLAELNLLNRLDDIISPVFQDENITKLGHGLVYDFKELKEAYPDIIAFKNIENILDTTNMYRKLRPNEKNIISLKKLTKIFLHLNLIKSQTCSDWGARPLTEAQLHYSACDALVLLRLFDAMMYEAIDLFGDGSFRDIRCNVLESSSSSMITGADCIASDDSSKDPSESIAGGGDSDDITSDITSVEESFDDSRKRSSLEKSKRRKLAPLRSVRA